MLMFFHAKETVSEKHTFWHFNILSNDLITILHKSKKIKYLYK